MIRHLLLTLALAAGVSSAAQAQVADVVQVCGASSGVVTPVGPGGRLTRDVNGQLCVSGGAGGGSGGSVTQGTMPWVISGNSTANGSGNPIFTQVTNFPATQPISAASLPLPTGAATAANQNSTAAGTSAANAQAVQGVTGGVALPISASALPLPAGAATSANQTTEIAALGAPADTAYAGSGTASLVAALKGVYSLLDQVPAAVDASYGPATTATNALAANAKRAAVYVFNGNTFPVYINFRQAASTTAAVAGNITVPAGGDWRSPQGMAPKTAMSIIAGTAGGVVTIQEGSVP